MNNGKQPITPSMWTKCGDGADDYTPLKDGQKTGWEVKFGGLTKREHFAAMAMQGMASSDYWSENFSDKKIEYLQKAMEIAVKTADELINQLNK
jgi:hypothetical protein